MKGTRSLLLKGAGWVAAGGLVVNLLGVVSTIVLARLLVPEDFGLVAIATAIAGIVGTLSEFSLSKALIQHRDPEEAHYHTAWTMNVIRGVLIGALIALLGQPLAAFYGDPRLVEILYVLGGAVVIGGLANPKLAVFDRLLSFSQSFYLRVAGKLAAFAATVLVAVIYQSYWALVLGAVASEIAVVMLSYVLYPFFPKPTLSKYRDLLSFSVWLTMGQWVQALNWRVQPLLFGYLLPQAALGQYSLGKRIVDKTIDQATSPLKSVLFPAFSRLQDYPERLRNGYLRALGVLCMLAFPPAVGFAVLAEDVVRLVIGEQWLPAVPIMQLIVMIRMVQLTQHINPLAMATGNTKRLFHRDLRALLIRWPLLLLGLYSGRGDPYSMLIGAMIGGICSASINSLLNMRLIAKMTTITVNDHFSSIWRSAVAVLAMAACVHFAGRAFPDALSAVDLTLKITALSALGALLYPSFVYALWIARGRQRGIETESVSIVRDSFEKARMKLGVARRPEEG